MSQIGIATNKKLVDLYNMLKSGSLKLAPAFQRKLVWNIDHKEHFLDTILHGFPFPEVYFADGDIDLATKTSTTLVVDGQQRIHTILEYVEGTHKEPYKKIQTFANLDKDAQTRFLDYTIVIRDLGRLKDDVIIEIFKRINSVNYALNAIEIKNALYQGEFISAGKEILDSIPIFKDPELFSEDDTNRMKDLEYVLLLMATAEEEGYFPYSTKLEHYIKQYDNEYPNKGQISSAFKNVAERIEGAKLPADSFWRKRSSFFTLFSEMNFAIARKLAVPSGNALRTFLVDFEDQVRAVRNEDPEKNVLADYYRYVFQNTGSKRARAVRGDVLRDRLQKLILG